MSERLAPPRRGPLRYLRDADVLHALVVALVAMVGSGGLVFVGYFIHVWRTAVRAPSVPDRRRVVLVFGRRLVDDAPEADYRQRLGRCLALMRDGQAERVLLLGGISGGRVSEAAAGAGWLRQRNPPADVPLLLEPASTDSLENLRHARELLCAGHAGAATEARLSTTLVTSRYHLARCLLLARRLGFDAHPVGAEQALPRTLRYVARMAMEAGYLMWIDLGMRWARLIGHQRMAARIA